MIYIKKKIRPAYLSQAENEQDTFFIIGWPLYRLDLLEQREISSKDINFKNNGEPLHSNNGYERRSVYLKLIIN